MRVASELANRDRALEILRQSQKGAPDEATLPWLVDTNRPALRLLARAIAACGPDYRVLLTVLEMDDKTETLEVTVEGASLDMDRIREAISDLGGSLHSIDEVEVENWLDAGDGNIVFDNYKYPASKTFVWFRQD